MALDYSLVEIEKAENFIKMMLEGIVAKNPGLVETYDRLFVAGADAVPILTEASGGNPRNLINILAVAIEEKEKGSADTAISDDEIREAARGQATINKQQVEQSHELSNLLASLLLSIIDLCRDSEDIRFHVPKADLDAEPAILALLGELMDANLIHRYDAMAPEGKAFVLDMGLHSDLFSGMSLVQAKTLRTSPPSLDFRFLLPDLHALDEKQLGSLMLIGRFRR